MNIGTVKTGKENKKLSICTINKRKASKENFEFASGNLVLDRLENKGRVYGIYQEKELVGIYIYERIEDFFVKVENTDSAEKAGFFKMTDDDLADFEDKLWGESKAIYRLVSQHLSDVAEEYKDEIEKSIVADLKAQIEWGQIAGVLSGEKLIYRRSLDKKSASDNTLGYGAGFTIGAVFGWLVFDSISMGLLWGVCYAAIGGLLFTNTTTKQEWTTFDFVNKKYVGAEEDK